MNTIITVSIVVVLLLTVAVTVYKLRYQKAKWGYDEWIDERDYYSNQSK